MHILLPIASDAKFNPRNDDIWIGCRDGNVLIARGDDLINLGTKGAAISAITFHPVKLLVWVFRDDGSVKSWKTEPAEDGGPVRVGVI